MNNPNSARRRLSSGLQGPHTPGGIHGAFLELRREDAKKRKEERDRRSPQQQLDLLDQRLGRGIGAKKERERLLNQIRQMKFEPEKVLPTDSPPAEVSGTKKSKKVKKAK